MVDLSYEHDLTMFDPRTIVGGKNMTTVYIFSQTETASFDQEYMKIPERHQWQVKTNRVHNWFNRRTSGDW